LAVLCGRWRLDHDSLRVLHPRLRPLSEAESHALQEQWSDALLSY